MVYATSKRVIAHVELHAFMNGDENGSYLLEVSSEPRFRTDVGLTSFPFEGASEVRHSQRGSEVVNAVRK